MVGIDVASKHVELAAIGAELPAVLRQVPNDADGHSTLAEALVRLKPELVLMEATGGYEAAGVRAAGRRARAGRGQPATTRPTSPRQCRRGPRPIGSTR